MDTRKIKNKIKNLDNKNNTKQATCWILNN